MEKQKSNANKFRYQLTRFLAVAAALVFVVGGTVLTRDDLRPKLTVQVPAQGSYDNAGDYGMSGDVMPKMYASRAAGDAAMYETAEYDADDYAPNELVENVETPAAKIIRTASLTISTRAYEEALAQLKENCKACGGWISDISETTTGTGLRRANLTLRVPSEQLDAYLEGTGAAGRITNRSETSTDVTDQYYDTKTRLATQQALLTRLQALITDAASLSELLELENQMANTQYKIDQLTGSLQSTDQRVNYATVTIALREESAAEQITQTEVTLGERIMSALTTGWSAFVGFGEDILVFLTASLPFLALVAAAVIVIRILRKRSKKNEQK